MITSWDEFDAHNCVTYLLGELRDEEYKREETIMSVKSIDN